MPCRHLDLRLSASDTENVCCFKPRKFVLICHGSPKKRMQRATQGKESPESGGHPLRAAAPPARWPAPSWGPASPSLRLMLQGPSPACRRPPIPGDHRPGALLPGVPCPCRRPLPRGAQGTLVPVSAPGSAPTASSWWPPGPLLAPRQPRQARCGWVPRYDHSVETSLERARSSSSWGLAEQGREKAPLLLTGLGGYQFQLLPPGWTHSSRHHRYALVPSDG